MKHPSILIYEDAGWRNFLPLVYMRATFQLRCGMFTLVDRILSQVSTDEEKRLLAKSVGSETPLSDKQSQWSGRVGLWCRSALADLVEERTGIEVNRPRAENQTLLLSGRGIWKSLPATGDDKSSWVGVCGDDASIACIWLRDDFQQTISPQDLLDETRIRMLIGDLPRRDVSDCVELCKWPWDIVNANAKMLGKDGNESWIGLGQHLGRVDTGAHLLNPSNVHLGNGSRVMPCVVIDAEQGPVWIGEDVTIFPNTYIQGPAFIGDGSVLQPSAVVRGGNTLGPVCKVGGEIEGSIIQSYSNKQHDGFLGHSYLGSWINIAADCVNSDLKNTYGSVRVEINGQTIDTGETFVGMFVGDYSKAGINVSFPTGSVVGFCSNVFAPRSPKFVPSFAWINGDDFQRYDAEKGLDLARKVMARRKRVLSEAEEKVFRNVREQVLALEHQPQRELEVKPTSLLNPLPTSGMFSSPPLQS